MYNLSLLVLFGISLFPASGLFPRDLQLPAPVAAEIERALADLTGGGSTSEICAARDRLTRFGTVVEPMVREACARAGKQARWGLVQTLGLTGGPVARRFHLRALLSRTTRNRSGLVCFHALGLRHPTGDRALTDLLRSEEESRASWLRLCGLLGLVPVSYNQPPPEVVRFVLGFRRFLPQEKGAALLFLSHRCGPGEVARAVERFWPAKGIGWGSRLVRRSCALAAARHPQASWRERLVGWLGEEGAKPEDYRAAALTLGAVGLPRDHPLLGELRARPRAWAGYLSRAALLAPGAAVREAAHRTLSLAGGDEALLAAAAGAYARCLEDGKLAEVAAGWRGGPTAGDLVRLELARRVLESWRDREGKRLVRLAASRNWSRERKADRLLMAALAVRGALGGKGEGPPGWGLLAKALRGEVSRESVARAVTAELAARGAAPDSILVGEENELARAILLGHSAYFKAIFPDRAPASGQEVATPAGAPAVRSFYEQLHSFLQALPLVRSGMQANAY